MQTRRRLSKWLIEENKKIEERDKKEREESIYSSGCSEFRKATCKAFWNADWWIKGRTCKDYDNNTCPLK